MQSPGMREVTQACFNSCFTSTPFSMNIHDPLNPTPKQRSSSSNSRHDFAKKTVSSFFPDAQFTNHESLPSLEDSFIQFNKVYPQYLETNQIDKIRASEYFHLSLSNHVCLDYIGIGLFSHYQLQHHYSSMLDTASSSASSHSSGSLPLFSISYKSINLKAQLLYGGQESKLELSIKNRIMDYLNISETDYSVVFTANRRSAFKVLAESYPFHFNRRLLTVYDYESEAVEGLISSSEKRGARVFSAEFKWPRFKINSAKLKKIIVKRKKKKGRGLFVFPLQSRMSGARYPYIWMRIAQENGWHVLLDACALGPKDMDCFGISLIKPDFIISSFYNVFGEDPSGFGCLIVKKTTIPMLQASDSAGIVTLVPVKKLFQLSAMEDEEDEDDDMSNSSSFSGPNSISNAQSQTVEQGEMTSNSPQMRDKIRRKGNLQSKCSGLDHIDSFGLVKISNRARYLINWLVNALTKLQHPCTEERTPLVKIYGPKIKFDRAPALAFNIFDWKGDKVDPVLVQKLADRNNISVSNGFLHQVWFSDKYEQEKKRVIERREKGEEGNKRKDKTSVGITVVTAALGFLSNFEDVYRVWAFLAQFLNADYVEKERWRYIALNQKTIEI